MNNNFEKHNGDSLDSLGHPKWGEDATDQMIESFEKNYEEIKKVCGPYIEQFGKRDKSDIISILNNHGAWLSSARLMTHLEHVLDVDIWENKRINRDEFAKKYGSDCEGVSKAMRGYIYIPMNEEEADSRDGNAALDVYESVAHEMFHVYQGKVSREGGEHADIYRAEYDDYRSPLNGDSLDEYATQMVEQEAHYFGWAIRKVMLGELLKARESNQWTGNQ